MAATIKDIAKQLNISVSTVSYALNGGPRNVPDEVRERVLRTAKDLGYRPNRNARSLITRRTYAIGVVPSQLGENIALGPYFQQSLNGIINEAEARHYDVLIFTRYDQSETEMILDDLLDGRVDGLIFLAPPVGSRVIDIIADQGIPFVVIGSDQFESASCFTADNEDGVIRAMDYLVGLGHRKIGHLYGKTGLADSIVRERAFRKYVADHELRCPEEWIRPGDFTAVGAYETAKGMLSLPDRPTAVFCANDEMAMGLIRAARELDLRVPEDVSVVGFDNSPLCTFCFPPLTTICQPMSEIATQALRSVVALVEGEGQPSSHQFPTELIVRDSAARPQEDLLS